MGRGHCGQNPPREWTPPPPSWVFLSTILNVLADKKKLKIDCNFQFSIFRLATDCNIVGKATLPLSFIFLFIVDRIKVKIEVIFQYSINGKKKSPKFSIWHFRIFYDKNNENKKLTLISNF